MYPNVLNCRAFLFAICMAAFFLDESFAHAIAPVLEWDPNPEPTIAGYNVYTGTASGNYTQVIDVGLQTSVPLTNLLAGVTHFFAVTAYDTDRLESPFSDEVSYTPRVDGETAILLPFILKASQNDVTIRFSGEAGQRCWIAASADLIFWEQVHGVTFTEADILEYADAEALTRPMRFYRVVGTGP